MRRLLEGGAYFNADMQSWKYGIPQQKIDKKQTCGFKFQIIDDATMVFP